LCERARHAKVNSENNESQATRISIRAANFEKGTPMFANSLLTRICSSYRRIIPAAFTTIVLLVVNTANAGPVDWLIDRVMPGSTQTIISDISPDRKFIVRIKGQIKLSDELDDVLGIGSRAIIEETRAGTTRRIVFLPDANGGANGGVKRSYYVNARATPFDAEGKRWLADMLKTLVRESAFESEKRVKNLYTKGGAEAVIAEIEQIKSGFGRGKYIEELLKIGAIDDKQFERLLKTAKPKDSSFERRQQLVSLIGKRALISVQQVAVLNAVAQMDSAFEQRGVLSALTSSLSQEPIVATAWLAVVGKMDSDFEVQSIIEEVMRAPIARGYVDAALQASLGLHGNFERANALKAILKNLPNPNDSQLTAFLNVVEKIDGDFERQNVLIELINKASLDKRGYAAVLQAINGMHADFEISNVLVTLAKKMPADSELVARYRKAARNLSDHERGQAERALDHLNL
jgi:hypothetical protein